MITEKMAATSRQKYLPVPEPTITFLQGIVDFEQVKQKMINMPQVEEKWIENTCSL